MCELVVVVVVVVSEDMFVTQLEIKTGFILYFQISSTFCLIPLIQRHLGHPRKLSPNTCLIGIFRCSPIHRLHHKQPHASPIWK
jgi:hypothetical protein